MAGDSGRTKIPGTGMFLVGIDIAPGRYRCTDARGGRWIRFTGPGGSHPVGGVHTTDDPVELEIDPSDVAFETLVPGHWRLVAAGPGAELADLSGATHRTPAIVVDPELPGPTVALLTGHRRNRLPVTQVSLLLLLLAVPPLGGRVLLAPMLLALTLGCVLTQTSTFRRRRALRASRGRYLRPADFDEEARALLARTDTAVTTVLESEVNRQGLLDSVDNAVTLPRQRWEIAQLLARQSRLRTEQRSIASAEQAEEIADALRPLREKLDTSVKALTRRVEALERYAGRTRAADAALRAHRHLEALSLHAEEYQRLEAEAVRDDLAVPAIDRLTRQSEELTRTLKEQLEAAAQAGSDVLRPLPEKS